MKVYSLSNGDLLCAYCGYYARKRYERGLSDVSISYIVDSSCLEHMNGPYHCDQCEVFLENPLSPYGIVIVRNLLNEGIAEPSTLEAYRSFYERILRWNEPSSSYFHEPSRRFNTPHPARKRILKGTLRDWLVKKDVDNAKRSI